RERAGSPAAVGPGARDSSAGTLRAHRRARDRGADRGGVLRPDRAGRRTAPDVLRGSDRGPGEAGAVPGAVAWRGATLLSAVRAPPAAHAPFPVRHRSASGGPLAPPHGRGIAGG